MSQRIDELHAAGVNIEHVDLYGGEVGLLEESYLNELDSIVRRSGNPLINVVTNLSMIHPYFLHDHIDLAVSYDFDCRQSHEQVLQNMVLVGKQISVLLLASSLLVKKDVGMMIDTFNGLQNVRSVEIKPYSSNQANVLSVSDQDFEEFVKKWLLDPRTKNFEFINEVEINKALKKTRNAFSNDHLYITPQGKFAVLEFDNNQNEFFLELDSYEDYVRWQEIEKQRVHKNIFCRECEYLGNCLTEHYRDVKSLEKSCNGFRHLLDWSKTNIKT